MNQVGMVENNINYERIRISDQNHVIKALDEKLMLQADILRTEQLESCNQISKQTENYRSLIRDMQEEMKETFKFKDFV